MPRDIDNPDTAGKDMDMDDVTVKRCAHDGCLHRAERGKDKCAHHLNESDDLAEKARRVREADREKLTELDDVDE